MEQYELKLFGAPTEASNVRNVVGKFAFSAGDNLSAIRHAKDAFSEGLSACDYAVLRHEGSGVIWESYAPHA